MLKHIPRQIFQTWKTHKIPEPCKEWVASWKIQNPEYSYTLFDNKENRIFIEKEFPWFLDKYDSYSKEIYRADLVRYFYLYKYGGIYADIDFECMRPFEPLLCKLEKEYGIILGRGGLEETCSNVPNALMISAPQEFFWMFLIAVIIDENIDDEVFPPDVVTGPVALKKALHCYTMRRSEQYTYKIEDIDLCRFRDKDNVERLKNFFKKSSVSPISILDYNFFYSIDWFHVIDSHHRNAVSTIKGLKKYYKWLKKRNKLNENIYAVTYWMGSWRER